MTGKEKCELLRSIRKMTAARNNIAFQPKECTHTGPCSGTCPMCDEEARYLQAELQRKAEAGERIFPIKVSLDDFKTGKRDGKGLDWNRPTLGMMPPPEKIRKK